MRGIWTVVVLAVACGASSPAWSKSASLWVADGANSRVVELSPIDLKNSGSPTPIVLDGAVSHTRGLAFDNSQNLWVCNTSDRTVLEFTSTQLKNLGTVSNPTPTATIGSTDFVQLVAGFFDARGNLWIVDEGNSVHELSKTQLNAGSNANITPAITITSVADFHGPHFGTFDKSGNLWISSEFNNLVLEFNSSQLGSGGDKTPTVVLSPNGSSLSAPGQLAFDRKGNLWVANYDNNTVVMFAKSALSASGMPLPKVTLSTATFDGPWGLALDGGKNLWIYNWNVGVILKISSKNLNTSGAPAPSVTITGATHSFADQIVFGPVF